MRLPAHRAHKRERRVVHEMTSQKVDDPPQSERRDISIEVSADQHLIFVTFHGSPRPETIIGMLDELDGLIAQNASLRVLIDETDLRPSIFGPGDIGRFSDAWRRGAALRSSRIAVFVSNIAMYGLNRMFEGLANAGDHMGVFHTRGEALAWLDEAPTQE